MSVARLHPSIHCHRQCTRDRDGMSATMTAPQGQPHLPLCPFDLSVDFIDRMLNFEIADDPTYDGLEVQVFDDNTHGRGMVVLLTRRSDHRVDCYRQPGLSLDRSEYGIGAGIGVWLEVRIDPAHFNITPQGVDLHVRLRDATGRLIDVQIDDRGDRGRRPASLLAPFGAGIQQPDALMLVWMKRFDLLRQSSHKPEIHIDGREVRTGRLPGAWLHRRHLIKYAADIAVVRLNTRHSATLRGGGTTAPLGNVELDASGTGIVALRAEGGRHSARFELPAPLPSLNRLPPGDSIAGSWRIAIDGNARVVGGTWTASRARENVALGLDVTQGWRPTRLPPLMRVVTTIARVFRDWPTTYRWQASVQLTGDMILKAGWVRTNAERSDSYRWLTGTEYRSR
jgi:hypothetical protein